MKNDYCHISIVLDRSGSMGSIAKDTIGGLNTFIEEQKKVSGEATLSLMQFDNSFETVFTFKDIQTIDIYKDYSFIPRGMTALYDAIGKSIADTGEALCKMEENNRPSKVIFVIVTDGEENSSKEYSQQAVQDMIKHQSEVYSWEFVFLGANIDAVSTGTSLGIKGGNTITYAANTDGVTAAYGSVSANLSAFRTSSGITQASFFSQSDRDAQIKAGV